MSLAMMMVNMAARNQTLLDWVYPSQAALTKDFRRNWVPFTDGCAVATDCYCHHVEGDMSRAVNPNGWKKCAHLSSIGSCHPEGKACNCLHGRQRNTPCLFSDMRPTKILAAITVARAAGITHIIEEGRYGGLSALMYALHGFDVTSIEFLPLMGATIALQQLAPQVRLLDGDGSKLLPQLVGTLSPAAAARTTSKRMRSSRVKLTSLKKCDDVRKRGKTSYRSVWLTSAKTSSKRVPSGPACECSFVRTASTRPAGIAS